MELCCRPACKRVNEATSKSILGYQYDQLLSPCRCKVSPLHPLSLIITHTYQALNILIIAKVIKAVKLRHLISLACQLPCLHGAACLFRWPHIPFCKRVCLIGNMHAFACKENMFQQMIGSPFPAPFVVAKLPGNISCLSSCIACNWQQATTTTYVQRQVTLAT